LSDVYFEWENEGNISLETHQDVTESWWNRLNPVQRYNIFPWATGMNDGSVREMIRCDEYKCKFDELDSDIQEEIVEKYAVQKGLVTVPENTNLPHWEDHVTESERRILEA
jgi:hypothetical protein